VKFLITGASGLVGGAVARLAAQAGHDVVGVVGRFSGDLPGVSRRIAIDLSQQDQVVRTVEELRPDVVINAAAVSEPAACDQDPMRSQRLNVDLPAWLAGLANRAGFRLVHLSSEQAFRGDRAPYRREDPVDPINLYARQKVASEQAVQAAAPNRAATVRAPLLAGNSPSGRRSLHERLLADWAAGRTPRLYVDEIRQVCHADNLAAALIELAQRPDLDGVFHWAGAEPLSRYDLGLRIREHFGLDARRAPLLAVRRSDDPEASAVRQADLTLDLAPLDTMLVVKPETFAEQLAQMRVPDALRDGLARA